jgi:hypothetical protein
MPFIKKSRVVWTVQIVLALLFLFAGGMKLVLPIESLNGPVQLPGLFLRFIGVAEVTGALGLILPGLLRVRLALTPLAAVGLILIMTGATVITLIGVGVAPAVIPLVMGLLASLVVYGRSEWASQLLPISRSVAGARRS